MPILPYIFLHNKRGCIIDILAPNLYLKLLIKLSIDQTLLSPNKLLDILNKALSSVTNINSEFI